MQIKGVTQNELGTAENYTGPGSLYSKLNIIWWLIGAGALYNLFLGGGMLIFKYGLFSYYGADLLGYIAMATLLFSVQSMLIGHLKRAILALTASTIILSSNFASIDIIHISSNVDHNIWHIIIAVGVVWSVLFVLYTRIYRHLYFLITQYLVVTGGLVLFAWISMYVLHIDGGGHPSFEAILLLFAPFIMGVLMIFVLAVASVLWIISRLRGPLKHPYVIAATVVSFIYAAFLISQWYFLGSAGANMAMVMILLPFGIFSSIVYVISNYLLKRATWLQSSISDNFLKPAYVASIIVITLGIMVFWILLEVLFWGTPGLVSGSFV